MKNKRRGGIWQTVFLVLVALSLWWVWSGGTSSRSAADLLAEQDAGVLGEALLELSPAGGSTPSYNRDEFGPRWSDVDRNGCDTRNDILARDLTEVTFRSGTHDCVVETGTLDDPYTGQVISFQRGDKTSSAVQIDHVVALADAWRSGAHAWSATQREQFANDPLNLLAVDGPANQQKSALAADEWLPARVDFQCEFVARQIAVKSKWDLSVTDTERNALAEILVGCAN